MYTKLLECMAGWPVHQVYTELWGCTRAKSGRYQGAQRHWRELYKVDMASQRNRNKACLIVEQNAYKMYSFVLCIEGVVQMYVRVYSFVLCIKGLYTKLYKVDTASQCNRNKACFIVD